MLELLAFTTCPPASVPEPPPWLLSPEYVAVIVSVPTGKLVVVQVAVPGVPDVTGVVPHPVFALHVTVPVTSSGLMPFLPGLRPFTSPYSPGMVAVNVTDCPYVDGFKLEPTVMVPAPAVLTVCPPASVPALPLLFVSPEYVAVTVWFPAANVEMLSDVAEPEASVTAEPKALPSTLNCTVPVGLDPVTVAVKLTDCP